MPEMQRRTLLKAAAVLPLVSCSAAPVRAAAVQAARSVRPGEPGWPGPAEWAKLGQNVGGRLVKVEPPFAVCTPDPGSAGCTDLFQNLGDPYYIDGSAALTQTLGWTDAWTSAPSAYAVLAASSADVAAAVNFAREHRVRLVVKGAGHSYLGASNAPDSLLIWTRPNMRAVRLNNRFVPQGAAGLAEPETAVSVGAGAIWMDAYHAVTTVAGRYVQGGGCTTVGVAGLVQGGGFGSFSKGFGTAAANLLEAEVVTADGTVRIANAAQNPDLFWALKGGGGGTFGVVTRLTLRTHPLPAYFGAVFATITATSDGAYLTLVEQMISFYRDHLLNPHWGEKLTFGHGPQVTIGMLFQGLTTAQAEQTWAPLFAWVTARPADYTLTKPEFLTFPAQDFWNPAVAGQIPGLIVRDDLPGAPSYYYYWATDAGEVGWWLHTYQSTWLSQRLLDPQRRPALASALVRASQLWGVGPGWQQRSGRGPRERPAVDGRYLDEPGGPGLLRAGDHHGQRAPGLSRHPRARAECRPGTAGGENRSRRHGAAQSPRAAARLLRQRNRLFRGRLADGVLGRQLRPAHPGEGPLRSRWPVLRPPWRRHADLVPRQMTFALSGSPQDSQLSQPGAAGRNVGQNPCPSRISHRTSSV